MGAQRVNRKSLWAVVAGVLATVVGSTLVDILLHGLGVFPSSGEPLTDALAVLATSYRLIISVGAAWLTARLAPTNPMKHAMILGVVGTVLGVVGVAATWNRDLGPKWYPIALAVLAIPQCWLGGKLYEMKLPGR
jgi:hypothetical protein